MQTERRIQYPTLAELIATNRSVTSLSGDPFAILHPDTLDYLVDALPYRYNLPGFRDAMILKAAFLLDMLANRGHIFLEGNKRTALSATVSFLDVNGFLLQATDVDRLGVVLSVARGEKSLKQIAAWLEQRIKAIPSNNDLI